MSQTLTVILPNEVYDFIKSRADEAHRSVEDEATELLKVNTPRNGATTVSFDQSLASLELLDNVSVERAAKSHLASELATELESLHFKKQREGLSDQEAARSEYLVRAYEQAMLKRAYAAAVLKKRGIYNCAFWSTEGAQTT